MKPLLIIALIAIFGNVVVGVINRQKFIAARKEKDNFNRTVYENFKKVDDINVETSDLIDKFVDQDKNFEKDKYEKEQEEKTALAKEKEDKEVIAETDKSQKEIDATNAEIQAAMKDFPGKPEDLPVMRDALKAEIESQETKLAALQKEIEVTNAVVAENQKSIGRHSDGQTQRGKTIALSQQEGIITAVNNDWGFVVVNMGKVAGVSNDSRLLVKRGNQLIGKLNITQIENNLTVADIDGKSIRGNNRIQPGDQVIFDSAN